MCVRAAADSRDQCKAKLTKETGFPVVSLKGVVFTTVHPTQVLSSDVDLLHPPAELEKQKHKLKRLVQSPNSFFMDVKCAGCFQM